MEVLATQIAQLQEQIRSLPVLVSENEAHKAQLLRQSSDIQHLKGTVEYQRRVMIEISKAALPGGHWILEEGDGGKEGKDVWVWSREKYESETLKITTGPPATLDSLPNELLDQVISNLPQRDQFALGATSFKYLQHISKSAYSVVIFWEENALTFALPRISDQVSKNARITPLLNPISLKLQGVPPASSFDRLDTFFSSSLPPARQIEAATVITSGDIPESGTSMVRPPPIPQPWHPPLQKPDPRPRLPSFPRSPTIVRVPSPFPSFWSEWNNLYEVLWVGKVYLLEGSARSAACEAVLRGRGDQQIDINLVKGGEGGAEVARMLVGETEMASMEAFPLGKRMRRCLLLISIAH